MLFHNLLELRGVFSSMFCQDTHSIPRWETHKLWALLWIPALFHQHDSACSAFLQLLKTRSLSQMAHWAQRMLVAEATSKSKSEFCRFTGSQHPLWEVWAYKLCSPVIIIRFKSLPLSILRSPTLQTITLSLKYMLDLHYITNLKRSAVLGWVWRHNRYSN